MPKSVKVFILADPDGNLCAEVFTVTIPKDEEDCVLQQLEGERREEEDFEIYGRSPFLEYVLARKKTKKAVDIKV
jgi:hypothetical protein